MPSHATFRRLIILSVLVSTSTLPALGQCNRAVDPLPKPLPVREQEETRERWLKTRLETMLLPMTRRHNLDISPC